MSLPPNTRLGQYEIVESIGSGGMGLPTPGQEETFFLGVIAVPPGG